VYVTAHNSFVLKLRANDNAASVSTISTPHFLKVFTGQSRYQDQIRSTDIIRLLKSNLDIYLDEDVYICENDDN
jgi:hypothetical protein